jgi:C-terminal processing protease CtpA/Prc
MIQRVSGSRPRALGTAGAALLIIGCAGAATACAGDRGTIGALIGQSSDGKLTVREAPKGLGAAKAGIQPGDEILLIDGIDVRTLDERRLQELLSGDVGSGVKLTLVRGNQVIRVTVQRTAAIRYRLGGAGPGGSGVAK